MAKFDVILFDLGSTLIYFDGDWTAVMPQAIRALYSYLCALGLDLDESFMQEFNNRLRHYYLERDTEFIEYTTHSVLRSLMDELGFVELPESKITSSLAALHAVTQQHWQPEVQAKSVLESLKSRGYRLGLVSNAGDDADVQRLVDKAELRAFFDVILTSASEGIRKPNPAIFHKALYQMDATPSGAAMVGDTLGADILGAINAGIFSIWITRWADTPANRAHADTISPDAKINTLDDLIPLLNRLNDLP